MNKATEIILKHYRTTMAHCATDCVKLMRKAQSADPVGQLSALLRSTFYHTNWLLLAPNWMEELVRHMLDEVDWRAVAQAVWDEADDD